MSSKKAKPEPTFRQRLIASLAKEAVSMKGIAAVTDAALRTYDCLSTNVKTEVATAKLS